MSVNDVVASKDLQQARKLGRSGPGPFTSRHGPFSGWAGLGPGSGARPAQTRPVWAGP
ncbi:hypothetical protein QJS10_CPB22g01276 [Acorus calamus]|uniref:Uncharacterized protein n=1 Tax=Acorus calamus TaxID=4465 RepID=A0AAV9C399_ACOCL|nr:hypothetical protein QJS10_CPB22g01276 [Acorus calamus]